jgi:hypothetical protein
VAVVVDAWVCVRARWCASTCAFCVCMDVPRMVDVRAVFHTCARFHAHVPVFVFVCVRMRVYIYTYIYVVVHVLQGGEEAVAVDPWPLHVRERRHVLHEFVGVNRRWGFTACTRVCHTCVTVCVLSELKLP